MERGSAGDTARVSGSIVSFLFAPDDREAVIGKMVSPQKKIVSRTITGAGYHVHSGTGEFDAEHADIRHDLVHPQVPVCSFGFLLEALDRRRRRGQAPFTVMSCDKIQGNGDVAKRIVASGGRRGLDARSRLSSRRSTRDAFRITRFSGWL